MWCTALAKSCFGVCKTASAFCRESLLGNQSLRRAQHYSYPQQGSKQCSQSLGRASAEVGGSATKATNGTASAYHLIYSSQVPGTFHWDSSIRTQNVKENSAKFLSKGLQLHKVKGLSYLDSFCMRILKLLLGCSINFLFKWVLITFGRGLRDTNSLNVIWSIKSVTLSFSNPRQFLSSLKSYSDRSSWCWPNV